MVKTYRSLPRRLRPLWGVVLALVASAIVAIGLAEQIGASGRSCLPGWPTPASTTAGTKAIRHFEYVVTADRISVYDIDRRNSLVVTICLPNIGPASGVVASSRTAVLYISYGGSGGYQGNGSLLAYDLRRGRTLWQRRYSTGTDSMAITQDGHTIYMPAGEFSSSGAWSIIDAASGDLTGSIEAAVGAHNTIMGLDGQVRLPRRCRRRRISIERVPRQTAS